MKEIIIDYFWGILLIVIGIFAFLIGGGNAWGPEISSGQMIWVFVPIGILAIIQKKYAKSNPKFVICQKCHAKYNLAHIAVFKCPKCDGDLIHEKP